MHFTTTFLISALASTGLAAPTNGPPAHTATIQLANEHTGANANVIIPVDGVKRPVQELWGHTTVANHGLVFASSAQLTAFEETTVCTFTEEKRDLEVALDSEETYAELGKPVVDLCAAWVVCECEGM
ncbi:hypothetical protein N7466_003492 [Penicillium verhagenii]|uniref:uncharacterized protein n=1 Tax=Penicillium verhagenii TaxID=1562060 RepID=UPI0025450E5F|nr:uncharacterized protein N7466_003492 [Penicillium verhagenii]KAJ5937042.1 hypothetical protein N7466_003492 [Penicillium verhagenii]